MNVKNDNISILLFSVTTSAERMRKMRAKKKSEDEDGIFAAAESRRVELLRKKRFDKNPENERKRTRDRVRACRLRKKEAAKKAKVDSPDTAASTPTKKGYQTPQGLNKAMKKVHEVLSDSPSKAAQTVQGLANFYNIKLDDKMNNQIRPNRAIDPETIKLVKEFYFRTDIVYTMPGMNDEMTIWTNGKKEKLRKHYLVMYIKEAHSLFLSAYPNESIGYVKFANLRPPNVLLLGDTPEYQCKCRTHENFQYKLKGLQYEYVSSEFWVKYLCEGASYEDECWKGMCDVCKCGRLFEKKVTEGYYDPAERVSWKMWEKDESKRVYVASKDTCKGELLDLTLKDWAFFQEHVRVKHIQAEAFEKDKSNPDVTVCQCDFAMAYTCSYQNEIQSALWHRQSVNIFTVALYVKNQNCRSMAFATDCKDKGKNAVYFNFSEIA